MSDTPSTPTPADDLRALEARIGRHLLAEAIPAWVATSARLRTRRLELDDHALTQLRALAPHLKRPQRNALVDAIHALRLGMEDCQRGEALLADALELWTAPPAAALPALRALVERAIDRAPDSGGSDV